ncbi:unnamed protein product [Ilex paraguariensis]|uniref:Uncharacterized protein n=1 Tax=Ilex paraguariensis TaxID=185542 RepID=A0ABC8TBJ4_9AQUA
MISSIIDLFIHFPTHFKGRIKRKLTSSIIIIVINNYCSIKSNKIGRIKNQEGDTGGSDGGDDGGGYSPPFQSATVDGENHRLNMEAGEGRWCGIHTPREPSLKV